MTRSKLDERQIQELEQILEMVKTTEKQVKEMSDISTNIAHKWQKRKTNCDRDK
jgi:predicted fused transcriptional regulator/phosphomethylpyrimidine kinase